MEGQEVEWGLRNLVQHIDFYDDKYSRENDNCWIEEYDSKEDDSGEEEEEVYWRKKGEKRNIYLCLCMCLYLYLYLY